MISAGLLSRLSEEHPGLVDQTELLAGTSAGAVIVSALLVPLLPKAIYLEYQHASSFDEPNGNADQPAYDISSFVALENAQHSKNPRLQDLSRSVLFTTFNVGSAGVPWQPLLLHNLPHSTTATTLLVDAVVSSGAMPGMYGSYKGNVDGAFVHHDPTLAAIAAAVAAGQTLEDIVAICFGTGLMANWIADDTSQWGAQQWQTLNDPANGTPSLLVNGTVSPILNLCLNGTSTNLIPQLCRMLLGERYVYVNPTLNRSIPENDTDAADIQYMTECVASYDLAAANALAARYWDASQ